MKEDVLPEGWEIKKLESLADILDSQRKPINSKEREKRIQGKSDNKLFPYYGATGEVGKIDDYLFDEELVALGEDGVPFLDFNKDKAYMLYGKTWVNNHAHVLRAKKGITENKFLYYFLNQFDYRNYVNGGTRLKLTQANMRKIPVITPPLPEQQYLSQKLTALLDEVAQTKQRLEAIPALLKQFRQSVLADAVSGRLTEEWRKENDGNSLDYRELCISEREKRYGKKVKKLSELDILPKLDLPNSWSWKAIDEVCLKITDGTHHSPENTESGDYMYVTSKNVREGYIDLSNITYVDKETHKEIFARCDVAYGDVLYVKDGANTGLACVNNIEEQISLLSSVSVLKQCSFVNPHYLQHYLNSPIGRKLMLGMMSGTAIKRLTLTKIVASPIPIPPKEEQTQIVQKVETYFALADEIETQVKTALENVNLLTQSILAKAFNGELSAVWRNSQVTETQGNV